jgi:hypothetical protein
MLLKLIWNWIKFYKAIIITTMLKIKVSSLCCSFCITDVSTYIEV